MKLTTVWAVRDPSTDSVLQDICFELHLGRQVADYIVGSPKKAATWIAEHTALYTTEAEAMADATERMARRGRGK